MLSLKDDKTLVVEVVEGRLIYPQTRQQPISPFPIALLF
jgi:hypothetical protein